jgi:hypothetical protein
VNQKLGCEGLDGALSPVLEREFACPPSVPLRGMVQMLHVASGDPGLHQIVIEMGKRHLRGRNLETFLRLASPKEKA